MDGDTEVVSYKTVEDLRRKLNISRTTAWRIIRSGEIEVVRVGRCVRIPPHVFDNLEKHLARR